MFEEFYFTLNNEVDCDSRNENKLIKVVNFSLVGWKRVRITADVVKIRLFARYCLTNKLRNKVQEANVQVEVEAPEAIMVTDGIFVNKDVLVLGYGDGCELGCELNNHHVLHHDVEMADEGVRTRSKDSEANFKNKNRDVGQEALTD